MEVLEDRDVKKFLWVGKAEGYSFLVLLFIAMPLKHLLDMPMAVKIVGMLHGILFIMFIAMIANVYNKKLLDFKNSTIALLLSFIPFGTFFLKKLFISKTSH